MKLAVIKIHLIVQFKSLTFVLNIKMAFFSVEMYKLQLSIVFLFLETLRSKNMTPDITSTITNAAVRF